MTTESTVTFKGNRVTEGEEITPSFKNQIIVNWLEAIDRNKLIKFFGQENAKELEKLSLHDLQEILGRQETLQTILERIDGKDAAKISRSQTDLGPSMQSIRSQGVRGNREWRYERRISYICKELNNSNHESHNTRDCYLRDNNKNKKIARSYKAEGALKEEPTSDTDSSSEDDNLASRLQKITSWKIATNTHSRES